MEKLTSAGVLEELLSNRSALALLFAVSQTPTKTPSKKGVAKPLLYNMFLLIIFAAWNGVNEEPGTLQIEIRTKPTFYQ